MSSDSLGGMHLPSSTDPREVPAPQPAAPLPALTIDDEHFSYLKNYLPTEGESEAAAQQQGVKNKHASPPELPSPALSPIRAEGKQREQPEKRQRRVLWTHTEDVTILALHRHHGTAWETIAAQLPGRTADAVRNRCFRLQKQHPIATSEEGTHALDGRPTDS